MRARRVLALARYAVAGNLRTPYTWVGAALFLALAVLGLWSSARSGHGWVVDPSLTFDGALLATVFGVRSGLIAHRTGGLQTYLRLNFMSPLEHLAGATLGLLASWLLVCVGLFVLNLILPGGGLAEATWQASFFAVRTGVLIPFALVAESTTTIDVPVFMPALLYFGLVAVLVFALGQVEAMAALAPPVRDHDLGSLLPSVGRVAGAWGVALPLVIAIEARRS